MDFMLEILFEIFFVFCLLSFMLVLALLSVFLKAQGALRRIGPLEPRRKAQKKVRAFFHKAHYI